MLRPIPSQLLHDTVTVAAVTGVDEWGAAQMQTYTVSRVHLQSVCEIRKTPENTEVMQTGLLFVDTVRSQPALDWLALYESSLAAGKPMRVYIGQTIAEGDAGREVLAVDPVPDVPATRVHHIEVALK